MLSYIEGCFFKDFTVLFQIIIIVVELAFLEIGLGNFVFFILLVLHYVEIECWYLDW